VHRGVVCNPVVELPEGRDRRLDDGEEGCLSYPGAFVECARPDWASVTGQGLDGQDVTYEGDGLLARCLQHETDHIRGTVFGDRLSTRARKRLRKQMEAAAEDYPDGWPVEGPEPGTAGSRSSATEGLEDGER
jgi:peptide deformylase